MEIAMTAESYYTQPVHGAYVNRAPVQPHQFCARCKAEWHLGAIREGEDAKKITFAQLEAMAKGTYSTSTLRTYSRKDRGAGKFYDHMTIVGNEVRYDACESNLVILRKKNINTKIYEAAIAAYDRQTPTTRRLEALARQLAEDEREAGTLDRSEYSERWMQLWRHLNTRLDRLARMVDQKNQEFGFTTKDGVFVTDRFTKRKAKLRALFPELTDAAYARMFKEMRHVLLYHDAARLLDEGEPA